MPTNSVSITLTGGLQLNVVGITLYEESQLQEAASLWQEAENKLGAHTGGIGFMGSPSFVLGAVATSALFSRWQQSQMNKEAARLVEEANEKYQQALKAGREFKLGQIENVEWPDPVHWMAKISEDLKRKTFVPRPDGNIQFRTEDGKSIWIIWKHVAAFEPVPTP